MRSEEAQIRWNRVQNVVNEIALLPGVTRAHIDDTNMDDTGFNVDVSYLGTLGYPYRFDKSVNFRRLSQQINSLFKKADMSSRSIEPPIQVWSRFAKECGYGYDRKWGRFDVYCY